MISNENVAKVAKYSTVTHICSNCNKQYKDNSGLWRHSKKCCKETNTKAQELIQYLIKGPALLCYNDSVFTEEDSESIRRIENSRKYDKTLKIGKFGLGFNSVYHLSGEHKYIQQL